MFPFISCVLSRALGFDDNKRIFISICYFLKTGGNGVEGDSFSLKMLLVLVRIRLRCHISLSECWCRRQNKNYALAKPSHNWGFP